jgi:hypothetical protein
LVRPSAAGIAGAKATLLGTVEAKAAIAEAAKQFERMFLMTAGLRRGRGC